MELMDLEFNSVSNESVGADAVNGKNKGESVSLRNTLPSVSLSKPENAEEVLAFGSLDAISSDADEIANGVGDYPNEYLEIMRKAERFKQLNLLSGNRVEGGLDINYISKHYGKLGVQRYKLADFIMKKLDYRTSPDVLLMLSCTNKARIVIATAGAGKTTSLQFDLLISKMLDRALHTNKLKPIIIEGTSVEMPRILYLNYNNHNVKMITDRHNAMCDAINKFLKDEDAVDNLLESSTVHAFCHKWLKAFAADLDLPEPNIISDTDKKSVWDSIIEPRWEKFYGGTETQMVEAEVLDDLYNYKTESMLDWEDFYLTAKFVDTGLDEEFVKRCIKKYDSMKKQMKLMDFTDYLVLMIETLRNHPDIREQLQQRYRIIIADENQDFTRLMNELLIQLYNPEYNQIIIVGDPDQTIYDFKGVSPDNVVVLSNQLEDVQLLGLDTNYRCPDGIVNAAKSLLKMNVLRFEKPINTVRTGGSIITHSSHSVEEQASQVLGLLHNFDATQLANTVITYRNNASALVVAEELYYSGIPYNILDSRRPFNNPVFKHLMTILKALKVKDDFTLNQSLYRLLPMSKEQWFEILEQNRLNRVNHLHDLVLPAALPNGTLDALKLIFYISTQIDESPVCNYISAIVRMYRTYYFDFLVKQQTYDVQDVDNYTLYLDRAMKFFSRHVTFDYLQTELVERNKNNIAGVTLSTFHGLKGLEFDYVLAIDFNDSIFPNFFGIEQKYSRNTAMEEKESANRLCYVLVTRTIKELHIYHSDSDPSAYIGILTKANGDDRRYERDKVPEVIMNPVTTFDSTNAKMNFVKKLLGARG